MITIAITGGIACGKSTIANSLQDRGPEGLIARFDCDSGVAELFEKDDVKKRITKLDEKLEFLKDGKIDRKLLRKRAFESSEFREKLEKILHPLVLNQVHDFVKSVSGRAKIFLVEVPLLYEVEFPIERDLDLVVASSRQTQLSRLLEKRNVKRELAVRIIESQMSLEKKMKRADIVIWNDGSEQSATSQVDHLIALLKKVGEIFCCWVADG